MNPPAWMLDMAAEAAGLEPKAVGADSLRRALGAALQRTGEGGIEVCLARLRSDPLERRLFRGDAVVGETWLFREPESFSALAALARSVVRSGEVFRLLCAPCASGEEPASAAATLLDAGLSPGSFRVDAADASPEAVNAARRGFFPLSSRRGPLPPAGCRFNAEPDGLRLAPEALARISFHEADALSPGFMGGYPAYHAVFCRNLLIYLCPQARKTLSASIAAVLLPGGTLFTSPAEAPTFSALGLAPWGQYPPPASSAAAAPLPAPQAASEPEAARPVPSPEPGQVLENTLELALDEVQALADRGRLDDALTALPALLERFGPSARLHTLQGVALLAADRREEAEQALRKALYLDPAHAEALTHMELLRRAQGRGDEAALLADRAARAEEARP